MVNFCNFFGIALNNPSPLVYELVIGQPKCLLLLYILIFLSCAIGIVRYSPFDVVMVDAVLSFCIKLLDVNFTRFSGGTVESLEAFVI